MMVCVCVCVCGACDMCMCMCMHVHVDQIYQKGNFLLDNFHILLGHNLTLEEGRKSS